jgi:hypothetical protein
VQRTSSKAGLHLVQKGGIIQNNERKPTAPDNEMRLGSKCLLNAAAIRIGKYVIGTKMIILPRKLMSSMPRYPKMLKSAKISLMSLNKQNHIGDAPVLLLFTCMYWW